MDGAGLDTGITISSTVVETTPGDPGGPTDEVQTVEITPAGAATGGVFTLSIDSPQTGPIVTGPIAFDANGPAVDAALALAGLTDVSVTGPAKGPYVITFIDSLAATDIAGVFSVVRPELLARVWPCRLSSRQASSAPTPPVTGS